MNILLVVASDRAIRESLRAALPETDLVLNDHHGGQEGDRAGASQGDQVAFRPTLHGLEFANLQRRHPFSFSKEHLSLLYHGDDRFDLFRDGLLALLRFMAVQGDVGLNQALGKVDDEVEQRVVHPFDQRIGYNANHGLGLIRTVKLL